MKGRAAPPRLDPRHGESRLRRAGVVLAGLLAVLTLATGLLLYERRRDLPPRLVVATGSSGGTYLKLGQGVAELLAEGLPAIPVQAVPTGGSEDNVGRLTAGQAQLGFVQSDTTLDAESLRTVATLYEEVLQIVVPAGSGIASVADLADQRVNLGRRDSGTARVGQGVLRHHGLGEGDYRPYHLGNRQAIAAFTAGEIDAAVFLAGLATDAVADLLAEGDARLLPLGEPGVPGSALEALGFTLPGTHPTVVPAGTYGGQPAAPVGTLGVQALLVTTRDLPDHLVHEITRLLFENRFRLSRYHEAAAQMEEAQDPRRLRFRLHPGAASYYARNEPPFLVVYAEAISLALTLLVTVGSGLLALREWARRRKKNRIDVYYLELGEVSRQAATAGAGAELEALRHRLLELREQAFGDLVAERLEANESFSIFQDSLTHRLAEIAREQDRREPRQDPSPRRPAGLAASG